MRPREFKKVVSSRLGTDGAGVKINRLAVGFHHLPEHTPKDRRR